MAENPRILTTDTQIAGLLPQVRRVAVLGIRSEAYRDRPAFYVPAALAHMGLEIVPVALHESGVTHILGQPVYRSLAEVPGALDLVDVFRRPVDLPAHLEELLAIRPRAAWFQSGIRHDAMAERLAAEGILVVQDRCLIVEYRRYAHGLPARA